MLGGVKMPPSGKVKGSSFQLPPNVNLPAAVGEYLLYKLDTFGVNYLYNPIFCFLLRLAQKRCCNNSH